MICIVAGAINIVNGAGDSCEWWLLDGDCFVGASSGGKNNLEGFGEVTTELVLRRCLRLFTPIG